jgi:hypothetical protein
LNFAVLCKPDLFSEVNELLQNKAWRKLHIKTHHESWLEMKENNFSVFVFYFDDWEDKYKDFMMLLRESFADSVFVLIAEKVPTEVAKDLLQQKSFGVFDPKRDRNTIVEGIQKLLDGQSVHYRKEERFRAYPFVHVQFAQEKEWKGFRTSNLSFSGAEITGNIPAVKKGEAVKVKFETPSGQVRRFNAVIRWIKEAHSFGVEFIKKSE